MTALLWICVVGGVVVLAVGVLADGVLDGLEEVLSIGDDGVLVPALGAFVSAFGIVGLVVSAVTDQNGAVTIVGALIGGLVMAVVAARIVRSFVKMATDPTPTSADLRGKSGRIVTPVSAGAMGEVVVRLAGQPVKLNARCDQDLAVGTQVVIAEVLSPSAVSVVPEASFFGGALEGTTP